YLANPIKLLISVALLKHSHCNITSTFAGSTTIPSTEITCSKKFTFSNKNSHFKSLAYNSFFFKTSNTALKCSLCSSRKGMIYLIHVIHKKTKALVTLNGITTYSLLHIALFHLDLMVPKSQINLGKHNCTLQLIHQIIISGNRYLCSLGGKTWSNHLLLQHPSTYCFNSANSVGAILYSVVEIGHAPGIKLIENSTSHYG
ncbi:hypothetical protein CR513_57126, partial [Mucuna pruriens]